MSKLLHQDPKIRQELYGPSLSVDLYRQEIQRVTEAFWLSEEYDLDNLDEFCCNMGLNESVLLTEADIGGAIKGQLVNLVQTAIGFSVEAGVTAAGLGTTAPAGVAGETLVDCFFAVKQVAGFASAVSNLASMAGDLWELIKEFFTLKLSDGLQGIYDATLDIINGAGAIFSKVGLKLKEGLEKIRETIGNLLSKASAAAADFISMLIPGDAGVTGAAIQGFADTMAEDAFGMAQKVYDMIPDWCKEYWENPDKMEEFLVSGAEMVLNFVKKGTETKDAMDKAGVESPEDLKAKAEEDKEGLLSKIGGGAVDFIKTGAEAAFDMSPVGMLWNTFGDAIIEKIVKFIEGTVIPGIPKAVEMFHNIVPFFVAGLASFTIIMKEDYDFEAIEGDMDGEEGGEDGDEDGEEGATPGGGEPAAGSERKEHMEDAEEDLSHLEFKDIKSVAVAAVKKLRANESKKYSLNIIWEDID